MDYGHELAVGTFLTPQNQRPQDVVALAWLTEEVGLIDPTAIAVPLEDAAPVRHIQAALMRDQRAPAARALVDALVEVGQERARRLEKRAKGRCAVASGDNKGWSLYGAPWLQPLAIGGKSNRRRSRRNKPKPLPRW